MRERPLRTHRNTRPICAFGASARPHRVPCSQGKGARRDRFDRRRLRDEPAQRAGGPRRRARPGGRRRARAGCRRVGAHRDSRALHPGARPVPGADRRVVVARHRERVGGAPRLARGAHDRRGALPDGAAHRGRSARHRQDRPARVPAHGSATSSACACSPTASSSAGWNVTNLGADTPLLDIVGAAQATRRRARRAVGLDRLRARRAAHASSTLCAARLPGVRIVVGGPAFSKDRSWPAEDLLDPAELGLPGSRAAG